MNENTLQTPDLGPVMIDFKGCFPDSEELEKIAHPNVGGVILFARNFDSPEQTTEAIARLRRARQRPLLVTVDQEGGRVQRFQNGFTRLPPACRYPDDLALIRDAGWLMAAELRCVGIDFSFAPVLDVDSGVSEIIGNRAFANQAEQCADRALAFYRGLRQAGMAGVGKHFPGHGGVAADSHLTLPVDARSLAKLEARDFLPFQVLIEHGLEGVMPAHVVYPDIDDLPAGFSERWLKDILRNRLKFKGAIFSDDLSMAGAEVAGDYLARAEAALAAGCDMVLVLNAPDAAGRVLDGLPIKPEPKREHRLVALAGKSSIDWSELSENPRWQGTRQQLMELC